MEGEIGGRFDVADLALVTIQRNQVYAGACFWLPVKLHIWSFTNGQSSLQNKTFIASLQHQAVVCDVKAVRADEY